MAVSNIYAMREQVGEAALLFDPESVEEIAGAIRRLASDISLRQRLSRAGEAQAAKWGQTQFSARLGAVIETILES